MSRKLLALLSSTVVLSAFAGNMPEHSSMMGQEMHESMQKMQTAMKDMNMSGDAEIDFMRMMLPHHQGAIDMSNIYLKYGKNPEIRARAEKIISDQTKEIEEMKKLIEEEQNSSNETKQKK